MFLWTYDGVNVLTRSKDIYRGIWSRRGSREWHFDLYEYHRSDVDTLNSGLMIPVFCAFANPSPSRLALSARLSKTLPGRRPTRSHTVVPRIIQSLSLANLPPHQTLRVSTGLRKSQETMGRHDGQFPLIAIMCIAQSLALWMMRCAS